MKKLLFVLFVLVPSVAMAGPWWKFSWQNSSELPAIKHECPTYYTGNSGALYDADGNFKGNLNRDPSDYDSVFNPYGYYGNPYNYDSVWNPYGAGNQYEWSSPMYNPWGKRRSLIPKCTPKTLWHPKRK